MLPHARASACIGKLAHYVLKEHYCTNTEGKRLPHVIHHAHITYPLLLLLTAGVFYFYLKKVVSLVAKWSSGPNCVLNWDTESHTERNDECWVINHRFGTRERIITEEESPHVSCTWGFRFPHTKSGLQLRYIQLPPASDLLVVWYVRLLPPNSLAQPPNKTPNSRSRTCI